MAFTFSISVYFLGGFIFLFCYFSPLKCWGHFCSMLQFPALLPWWLCWDFGVEWRNPCMCSQPLLSLSDLWRASILDFFGVFNKGRTEKWGNWEEIFSAKLGYFCWVVEFLEDESCLLVGWWLLSPCLCSSPHKHRRMPTAQFLCPCPLLASGLSPPPHHSTLHAAEETLRELRLMGLGVQRESPSLGCGPPHSFAVLKRHRN